MVVLMARHRSLTYKQLLVLRYEQLVSMCCTRWPEILLPSNNRITPGRMTSVMLHEWQIFLEVADTGTMAQAQLEHQTRNLRPRELSVFQDFNITGFGGRLIGRDGQFVRYTVYCDPKDADEYEQCALRLCYLIFDRLDVHGKL